MVADPTTRPFAVERCVELAEAAVRRKSDRAVAVLREDVDALRVRLRASEKARRTAEEAETEARVMLVQATPDDEGVALRHEVTELRKRLDVVVASLSQARTDRAAAIGAHEATQHAAWQLRQRVALLLEQMHLDDVGRGELEAEVARLTTERDAAVAAQTHADAAAQTLRARCDDLEAQLAAERKRTDTLAADASSSTDALQRTQSQAQLHMERARAQAQQARGVTDTLLRDLEATHARGCDERRAVQQEQRQRLLAEEAAHRFFLMADGNATRLHATQLLCAAQARDHTERQRAMVAVLRTTAALDAARHEHAETDDGGHGAW